MAVSTLKAPSPAITGICDLITASLLPFIEPNPSLLSEELEKNMLLSLSSVHRKIKQLAEKSDKDFASNSYPGQYCCRHQDEASSCLENIVVTMVCFLSIDSRFIQHVSGNIFVSLSSLLTTYESRWIEFIHLLWISLEAVISSITSSTLLSSTAEPIACTDENLLDSYQPPIIKFFRKEDCNLTRFITLLQSRVANQNWFMVTAFFRILRNILKALKQENDEHEEAFVNIAVPFLTKIPWGLFSEIYAGQSLTEPKRYYNGYLPDRKDGLNETKDVLLGSLLQLFCSLVEQNDAEDSVDGPLGDVAVQFKFAYLLPQLLSCCFSKHPGHKDKCISQYLLHKLLIFMNRLSCYNAWKHSHPVLWLKLLRCYFEDLLFTSITDDDASFQNCFEGSPFLANTGDGYTCARHLQRQAIFLLLKCCITLSCRKETRKGCLCTAETPSFTMGLQPCSESCYLIGLVELSEWLQRCGFLQMLKGSGNYLNSCSRFALSFLQLYMEEMTVSISDTYVIKCFPIVAWVACLCGIQQIHVRSCCLAGSEEIRVIRLLITFRNIEDDMMFDLLLLLLDIPLSSLQIKKNANNKSLDEDEGDVLFHILNIFNPIHLFHLFLSLLHYDHLVLVDYLISKDTGIHCLQYLLRSLRLVCQSWSIFTEFSTRGSGADEPFHKRKKMCVDNDCNKMLGSLSSSSTLVTKRVIQKQQIHPSYRRDNLHSFENAKDCLVSLKRSVGDLHQKSLFPYNPRPLLKSLTKFEELCLQ